MATKFCLNCGGEFVAAVEECPDCELPLVDEQPRDHLDEVVGDDGQLEGEVHYELHEWAVESRVMLQQLLSSAAIRHTWAGTDLVVPARAEVRVDALVDQVEATTLPTLDPDAPKVAYDIDDWSDEQQTNLIHTLDEVHIAYEFDIEGAVVVLEENEERVAAILDRIEFADGGAPDGDAEDVDEDADVDEVEDAEDGGDDLVAMDVLSDLFVAADRLQHHATDAEGVLSMVARASDAERLALPYGFERAVWADILGQITMLRDLLEDDASKDDDIEEHARVLRNTLRELV